MTGKEPASISNRKMGTAGRFVFCIRERLQAAGICPPAWHVFLHRQQAVFFRAQGFRGNEKSETVLSSC